MYEDSDFRRNLRDLKMQPLYSKRTVILEDEGAARNSKNQLETKKKYGIVTDLHIGFEERFKGSGVRIQTSAREMLEELESVVEENKLTDLVIAGDVKSGIDRILQSEWETVPKFLSSLSKKCRVEIVPGNHDGGLSNLVPENVQLEDVNGILISDSLIIHGHTRPLVKFGQCNRILMGHVHPIFQKRGSPLSGMPVWAFLKVKRKSIFPELLLAEGIEENPLLEVVLIPSFNLELASSGYAFETARAERRLSPIVKELKTAEEALVITLTGEVIGDESMLSNVL